MIGTKMRLLWKHITAEMKEKIAETTESATKNEE